ncbi:methyltransferase domain-containing protein [Phycisphaerales bacterium AB-hyl4]|uniref:Methyltransferase domain-containing protein n=1 Tax=Natronomicrosphaera hydrolytica TaxID=3242702 RepID=A0ABV4U3B8_9BACT
MDDPALEPPLLRHALRGLARLNRLSATASTLARALRLHIGNDTRPWRVLDVACGGGDVTLDIQRRLQRAKLPVTLHGCDISHTAIGHAQQCANAAGFDEMRYFHCDVLNDSLPGDYDAMICSLFLHHLDQPAVEHVLRSMARQSRLVIVDDLMRSRTIWIGAWLTTRLVTRSPVVHVDGPRSVQGAFTVDEMRSLAARAGLNDVTIRERFVGRMLMEWVRPSG